MFMITAFRAGDMNLVYPVMAAGRPKLRAIGFALAAAAMTASRTLADAGGARVAGSPFVYSSWRSAPAARKG
ncbi:MAG: hypothetical protein ACOC05_07555 [Oceanicaulis sp.]